MYDAIVPAGGRGRRLGGTDKPGLVVGDRTLLERVVAAVATADRVVVVGPRRPLDRDVIWCQEDPAGAGPVAALAAGLPHTAADVLVVLAADLPYVAPAVPRLLRALDESGADVALLADPDGRVNNLAAAWRRTALRSALAAVGDPAGGAVRSLVAAATAVLVPDAGGWGRDCDTWDDVAAARAAEGIGRDD